MTASKNLKFAIQAVLTRLQQRGAPADALVELRDHLAYYEYDVALTKATSLFRHYYSNDRELVSLLTNAWTCQCAYYKALVQEADVAYWKKQSHECFVPVKEAEHRLKLERAITRCKGIRKELCEWQVRLSIII